MSKQARLIVAVHGRVHERDTLIVDAVGAVSAKDGALHADGGVPVDVALHFVGDLGGELAATLDLAHVHRNGGHRATICHRGARFALSIAIVRYGHGVSAARGRVVVLFLSFTSGVSACSTSSASSTGDAGGRQLEASDDDSGDDASTTFVGDAGMCANSGSSVCNDVANVGMKVTPACSDAGAPAMTGGAIADGTYVLVSVTVYAGDCTDVAQTAGPTTLRVTGGCIESIDAQGGAPNYAWSTSGNTLSLVSQCPDFENSPVPYTATPTSLSLAAATNAISALQKQ